MPSVPRQRHQREVVARVRSFYDGHGDLLGFQRQVLCEHLDAEHLPEFVDLTPEELERWEPRPLHVEAVMAELAAYMDFAWGKVIDHRGLSANRSIDKIGTYVWLLGLDDLLAAFEETDYPQYGAPKLALVCAALGLPLPTDEETRRMMAGERCVPDCEAGCG